MSTPFKRFTCSYPFNGSHWGLDLLAADLAEAEARLKALAWAKVDGEVFRHIDAETNISIHPAGAVPDPIERGFLYVIEGVFKALRSYCKFRNWMVRG